MTRRKAVRRRKALNRSIREYPGVRRDLRDLEGLMRRAIWRLFEGGRTARDVDPAEVSRVAFRVRAEFAAARPFTRACW